MVLRLTFGHASILFAGDIDSSEEAHLLGRKAELASAVLKVPRHGSMGASSEEFVAAVQPRLAIFSVAGRTRFGLPRDEILSRYRRAGAEILRTDRDGAITIETDGERLRYWTHQTGKRGDLAL